MGWLKNNLDNPYLTYSEKQDLVARTGFGSAADQ